MTKTEKFEIIKVILKWCSDSADSIEKVLNENCAKKEIKEFNYMTEKVIKYIAPEISINLTANLDISEDTLKAILKSGDNADVQECARFAYSYKKNCFNYLSDEWFDEIIFIPMLTILSACCGVSEEIFDEICDAYDNGMKKNEENIKDYAKLWTYTSTSSEPLTINYSDWTNSSITTSTLGTGTICIDSNTASTKISY